MYLATLVLPSGSSTAEEAQVLLKFFLFAKKAKNLAALAFINEVLDEMLSCFQDGEPYTTLWINL